MCGGHGGIDACLQISQPMQRADEPVADLLEPRSNGSIAGWLALDQPKQGWFEMIAGKSLLACTWGKESE
jgi:hypothetical protein